MSDEHEHQPFIKTPQQLITVVLLAFIVPIVVIILLVNFVGAGVRTGAGADTLTPEAIEARIHPVAGFELRDANAPRTLRSGEEVYKAQCTACHGAGVAGAPKTGDAAAWAPRLKAGFDALLHSAVKGKGAMPPQVGGDFDETEIARAVAYLANQAGGKFAEPQAPAPAAQAEAKPAEAKP